MRKVIYLVLSLGILSCQSVKKINEVDNKESVLFVVDSDTVTTREFKYVYNKNNATNDQAYTKEDIKEYFELYKKFKLKIAEARHQEVDSTNKFKREFNAYREELKKPYLTESKITDRLVKEAYDRFNHEINASHILLRVDENASPEDTLKAYNKLLEIKSKADEKSFSELASEYSEDPSAAKNGGNLGYFTSFQMVYPFETAAYNTPEGKISEPARTKFGYHIIKVQDRRKANGTVSVSHIMLRQKNGDVDTTALRNKIFEIHELATGGADWAQLVEQYSEDINSKKKEGKLQPFKVGQMPFEFQEAAFSLSKPGDISDPVKTPYGWHIIKLESRKPIDDLDKMKPMIMSRIKRDSRADMSKSALVKKLKAENGFAANEETYQVVRSLGDSILTVKELNQEMSNKTLFTVSDQIYTVNQFLAYTDNSKSSKNLEALLVDFEEQMIIDYEENHLEEKYYDYKMLVKEYREGIMLFQIMEDEVWKKAAEDTVGLKEYYNKNLDKYRWDERLEAVVYKSNNSEILNEIKFLIENDRIGEYSKKELENKFNAQTALSLQIDSGKYTFDHDKVITAVDKRPGVYLVESGELKALVHVMEVLPEQTKPLGKVRGLVISDYQNFLEDKWLKKLQAKYNIKINEEALNHVYKALVSQ